MKEIPLHSSELLQLKLANLITHSVGAGDGHDTSLLCRINGFTDRTASCKFGNKDPGKGVTTYQAVQLQWGITLPRLGSQFPCEEVHDDAEQPHQHATRGTAKSKHPWI